MEGKLTANEAYGALINNDLNWYVVEYDDGTFDLKHDTALSSILQCGADPAEWNISELHQCWNGEELGEPPFDGFDWDLWEQEHVEGGDDE